MKEQLARLYLVVLDFIEPLSRDLEDLEGLEHMFYRYGWVAPLDGPTFQRVQQVVRFRDPLARFIDVAVGLRSRLEADPDAPFTPSEVAAITDATISLFESLRSLTPSSVEGLAEPLGRSEFWRDVGEKMLDDLLDEYVRVRWPALYAVLRLWRVIRYDFVETSEPFRRPYTRVLVDWAQLFAMVERPIESLRRAYQWGDEAGRFEHEAALESLAVALRVLRVPVSLFSPMLETPAPIAPDASLQVYAPGSALRATALEAVSRTDQTYYRIGCEIFPAIETPGVAVTGLLLKAVLRGVAGVTLPLGETLAVQCSAAATDNDSIGVGLFPNRTSFISGSLGLGARIDLTSTAPEPWILLGDRQTSRVEITRGTASLSLGGDPSDPEVKVQLAAEDLALVIVPPQDAGAAAALVGGAPQRYSAPLSATWSSKSGLSLGAPSGLSIRSTTPRRLGFVTLDAIRVSLGTTGDSLRLAALASGSLTFGPVVVTVNDVGIEVRATPQGAHRVRDLDLELGFKPPSGVGVAVDTSVIRGGGFVDIDPARGEYKGVLALEVVGSFSVNALALVTTHTPDQRVSVVAAVSSQFTPIALGLGFTLNGVGGLVGVRRRVDTEALRLALRGPGLTDIFFPANPAAQAGRLLESLGSYFPAAEGRHVFGPAVKIGWFGIAEAQLAVLLEVPDPVRVILIGNVHTVLPSQANPIVVINVDVVGEIDFAKKLVAIDASLRDSKVVDFPVTGDLAFRMYWGDPPSFVLSIGGFHSQFRPPAGFPKLRRVTIPIGSGDNPRLDASGFLALTSNTAQVGAQVELYAAAAGLNIRGSVGFEALLEFSPFSFRADLSAGVSLRRHNSVLASVHLDATLTGPTPWRVSGEACLSLWFVDLCVDFDATFGRAHAVELPQLEPWKALQLEVQKKASWTGVLPTGAVRAVVTAPMAGQAAESLIDPHAVLTLRQKVLPLNRKLTRFAQGKPAGTDHFNLTDVKLGGVAVPSADLKPVKDWFAPAQFEALPASERLARDGFEQMDAGVAVASEALKVGTSLVCPLEYETVVVRTGTPEPKTLFFPTLDAQLAGAARSSVARAPLRIASLGPYAPPPGTPPAMAIKEEEHVVVSTADLSRRLDIIGKVSRGEAKLALAAYLELHPGERGSLQVVPSHEAA